MRPPYLRVYEDGKMRVVWLTESRDPVDLALEVFREIYMLPVEPPPPPEHFNCRCTVVPIDSKLEINWDRWNRLRKEERWAPYTPYIATAIWILTGLLCGLVIASGHWRQ